MNIAFKHSALDLVECGCVPDEGLSVVSRNVRMSIINRFLRISVPRRSPRREVRMLRRKLDSEASRLLIEHTPRVCGKRITQKVSRDPLVKTADVPLFNTRSFSSSPLLLSLFLCLRLFSSPFFVPFYRHRDETLQVLAAVRVSTRELRARRRRSSISRLAREIRSA